MWSEGVKALSVFSGQLLRDYGKDRLSLNAFQWEPHQQLLWVGGDKGGLFGWEVAKGTIKEQKATGLEGPIQAVDFDPQSGNWAVASARSVKVWDAFDRLLDSFEIEEGEVVRLSFTHDGTKLLVVGSNQFGVLQEGLSLLESLNQGKNLMDLSASSASLASLNLRDCIHRRFAPFPAGQGYEGLGREVAIHPRFDDVFLSAAEGQYIFQIGRDGFQGPLPIHEGEVLASAFSPQGSFLATGGEDPFVVLMELEGEGAYRIEGFREPVRSLAFSADEQCLAIGFGSTVSLVWTADQYPPATLNLPSEVTRLAFTSRHLLIAGPEMGISCWDYVRGEQLATFVPGKQGAALSFTPEGHYRATAEGARAVAFRLQGQIYTFEQFDLARNRPDKVLEALSPTNLSLIRQYRKAYQQRLIRQGYREGQLARDYQTPPSCQILNRRDIPPVTQNGELSLQVAIKDPTQPLDRLQVLLNGVPLYGRKGLDIRSTSNPQSCDTSLNIRLSQGLNKIQVYAINQSGTASLKAPLYLNYEGPPSKPSRYLLAVGVSRYQDTTQNLRFAAADAQAIARKYQSKKELFDLHIKTLINEEVTRDNLLKIRPWLEASSVDDQVILFVSGHGLLNDENDFFYATHETDFADPAQGGIRFEEIESLLDEIPARKKLLLIDACHSGEYQPEFDELSSSQRAKLASQGIEAQAFENGRSQLGLQNSFELMQQLFLDLRRGSGTSILSSSSGLQLSYEDEEWSNGAFTYALLHGITSRKADRNGDGQITASEIMQYMSQTVPRLTEGLQVPTFRRTNLEHDFRVW
jgi:hypothetical protein